VALPSPEWRYNDYDTNVMLQMLAGLAGHWQGFLANGGGDLETDSGSTAWITKLQLLLNMPQATNCGHFSAPNLCHA